MIRVMFRETRSSGSQPLPTGIFGGAHSQGLASTSAISCSKKEKLKLNEKLS